MERGAQQKIKLLYLWEILKRDSGGFRGIATYENIGAPTGHAECRDLL